MEQIVKTFEELDFTVVAEPKEYHVEFLIYDIEGRDSDGKVYWHKKGASSHPNCVDSLDLADVYLHGFVKWDGCSNWSFDEQDRVMLHGCCRKDILRYGEIMAACWDWASVLLPTWDI